MKIGFIILNYNSTKLTKNLAQTVGQFKEIDYVIVVDNCSTDGSYKDLMGIANTKTVVIKTDYNGGYSYGNNYGIRVAEKLGIDYAFISNPDVMVEEKTIDAISACFKNTTFSLLTCLQYEIDGKLGIPPILTPNTYLDDLLDCLYTTRKIIKKYRKKIDITKNIQEIHMFRGSFFAVSVKDFLEVNGFDENVFLYCEERILSKKLESANKKMCIITNCKYDHMHSKSIDGSYINRYDKIKLLYKSRMYFNINYNKIGIFKRRLLSIFMLLSLAEYRVADFLKGANK